MWPIKLRSTSGGGSCEVAGEADARPIGREDYPLHEDANSGWTVEVHRVGASTLPQNQPRHPCLTRRPAHLGQQNFLAPRTIKQLAIVVREFCPLLSSEASVIVASPTMGTITATVLKSEVIICHCFHSIFSLADHKKPLAFSVRYS